MQLIAKELGESFQGLMSYNLREACWLVKEYKFDDILMGYPTAEKGTWRLFFLIHVNGVKKKKKLTTFQSHRRTF